MTKTERERQEEGRENRRVSDGTHGPLVFLWRCCARSGLSSTTNYYYYYARCTKTYMILIYMNNSIINIYIYIAL